MKISSINVIKIQYLTVTVFNVVRSSPLEILRQSFMHNPPAVFVWDTFTKRHRSGTFHSKHTMLFSAFSRLVEI